MKRPWQVWLVFVVCVGGAAVAMGWLTRQAIETDELRRVAQADADFEQRVSLALWRMDTELAPIIAGEVIRAPWMYRASFLSSDTNVLAQQRQNSQTPNQTAQQMIVPMPVPARVTPAGEPSPLLLEPPAYVVCNFEATLDAGWRSPQVPEPALREFATACGVSPETLANHESRLIDLASGVDVKELLARLPNTSLPSLAAIGFNEDAVRNAQSVEQVSQLQKGLNFVEGNSIVPNKSEELEELFGQQNPEAAPAEVKIANSPPLTKQSKIDDYTARNQRYQNVAQKGILEQQQYMRGSQVPSTPAEQPAMIGVSRPVWVGERLLLARRVDQAGKTFIQGAWLDWAKLKTRLLAETVGLAPDVDLAPVRGDGEIDPGRMLAGLPVRLVINSNPLGEASMSGALRWSLWMGWGALVLAAVAAAALLGGVMALSERRAAFVSSVTHELRTPLTTFRMYAEMLARGMVPDAERRQEYLHTLERESERLTNLVENVLAYARLERGRRPHASDCVTPASLLERIGPRLVHRAEQAGMTCEIEVGPDAADIAFTTDQNVVEQILFNLVDNAAKYARSASDRRIHVKAQRNKGYVMFTVSDHGPGIPPRYRSGRIRPFGKSAEESAETAPGVGLGLALCGRLARELGGRLEIGGENVGGAEVSLQLPAPILVGSHTRSDRKISDGKLQML
jgi:signal transduction histidine kinase